ncbi:hypothetical protein FRC12_013939, partial [Ceratobasidium sp. 428]
KDNRVTLNPATREVLTAYWQCRIGLLSDSEVTKILDSMMGLNWKTFTALGVARLAAKHEVLPNEFRQQHWEGADVPSYTVGSGDIGYLTKQNDMGVWNPLRLGQASNVGVYNYTH